MVYPEVSSTIVFIVMAIVLFVRPADCLDVKHEINEDVDQTIDRVLLAAIAPLAGLYPQFLMKCVALSISPWPSISSQQFGLLSIGHAAFFGMGAYAGYATKALNFTPEFALILSMLVGDH